MSTVALPQHVDIDALKAAFEKKLPDLSARPSNTVEAFMTSTLQWVIDWAQGKDGLAGFTTSMPFAILQTEAPPQEPPWKRQRFFREQGHQALLGHSCLIVAGAQMTLAHVLQINARDLEELGNAIETAGLAAWPALLVDPASHLLVRCPAGIDKPRISMHLEEHFVTSASRETLDEILNKFDEEYTRHPEGFASIWCDMKERIVYRQAEQMVQSHLFLYLQTRVRRSHLIVREHQLAVGRADIAILDYATRKWVCVLELKVFRDKGLPRKLSGKIKPPVYTENKMRFYAWCAVGQAARYKSSMECELAFLCCFDAREKEPKFPTVEARATAEGIEYRQYRMHTKSGENDALIAV